ncbi:hypothetical protein ACWF94_04185 [Streptomyces sp. NPDC055078]
MLDTAPAGDRLTAAVLDGTLPARSLAEAAEHRPAAGLPVE